MSKDYAKPKSRARRSPAPTPRSGARAPARSQRRPVPGWLWLVTGVVVIGFVYGLFALKHRHGTPAVASGPLPANAATGKTGAPKKVLPPPPESKWTFHEVLAEKTVEVPDDLDGLKASEPVGPPRTYTLRCGAFTELSRADAQKAKLALIGLVAQVKTTTGSSGQTLYVVDLGPYTSKRVAYKELNDARRAKLEACRVF